MEKIHVQEVISGALELCSENFIKHKVKIIIDDFEPSMIVECNRIQITYVLFNLLKNSLDAIKLDENKWIKISYFFDELHRIISVTDSGLGINQEVVNKMMQPFFTTKNVNEGVGLGLSSSKIIMQNHKGDLLYDAKESHTKFNLIFKR